MSEKIIFEPTPEQFGIFWKYLSRPEVTDVDYNGQKLWITEFPQEICEKPELHKAMKKALIHESQPNLIKRIYHVVFRKNYIGQA